LRESRTGWQRQSALLCQRHLASLHLLRAGGERKANPGASGCCPRSCARHRGKRRMGGNPSVRAASVVAPYFRQDEALIRHVLTEPPDRVSYRMLNPTDVELQEIAIWRCERAFWRSERHAGPRRPLVLSGRNPRGRHSVIRFTPRVARGCPDWALPLRRSGKNRVGERE